jgi:hypothetical protein
VQTSKETIPRVLETPPQPMELLRKQEGVQFNLLEMINLISMKEVWTYLLLNNK